MVEFNLRQHLFVLFRAALLGFLVGGVVVGLSAWGWWATGVNARTQAVLAQSAVEELQHEQYYRGIYDTCVYFAVHASIPPSDPISICKQDTEDAYQGGWYEQPSHEWEWNH